MAELATKGVQNVLCVIVFARGDKEGWSRFGVPDAAEV